MACMTAEQQAALNDLQRTYGDADRIMLERTDQPYGMIWVQWREQILIEERHLDRNLFIRPNGERFSWSLQ